MIQLISGPIDHAALTEQVRRDDCGAVVTFLGTVRDLTDGRVTVALDYEAYSGMAEKKMAENVTVLRKDELLRFEEIVHFVRLAVPLGIDKIRLTGGEPLMRRELPRLVRMLRAIDGIRDLGMTTNGILLADQAQEFYDAG